MLNLSYCVLNWKEMGGAYPELASEDPDSFFEKVGVLTHPLFHGHSDVFVTSALLNLGSFHHFQKLMINPTQTVYVWPPVNILSTSTTCYFLPPWSLSLCLCVWLLFAITATFGIP